MDAFKSYQVDLLPELGDELEERVTKQEEEPGVNTW